MTGMQLIFSTLSDVGKLRDHNEDAIGYKQPENADEIETKGQIFLVADGMGGHAAGEVASKLAVETVIDEYYSSSISDTEQRLKSAFETANRKIFQEAAQDPAKAGMGTTLVCALFRGDLLFLANVGDSRAYLLHDGSLTQLTIDHTWVQAQVLAGFITEEVARYHQMRNVLTRALGTAPAEIVDLTVHRIKQGDVLMLCSDGLSGVIENEDIRFILAATLDPNEAARRLVDAANTAGGPDNISVIVIRVMGPAKQEGDEPGISATRRNLLLKQTGD